MFLMDNTTMDRIATKIKLKTHILFTMSEFDNYYKIAVRDQNFGASDVRRQIPKNKYQASNILSSDFPKNLS